jgi:hypothetical protein
MFVHFVPSQLEFRTKLRSLPEFEKTSKSPNHNFYSSPQAYKFMQNNIQNFLAYKFMRNLFTQ